MKKYYGIEFLRFLTSISVLLFHYKVFLIPYSAFHLSSYYDENKINLPFYSLFEIIFANGFYGVDMFFAISGFVFAYVYLSKNNKIQGKEFFVNRFARLYPLHFATLMFVCILQISELEIMKSFFLSQHNNLYHFLLNIFFVSAWGFEDGVSFNTPIWSVSIEIVIYVAFFLLIKYLRKFQLLLPLSISIFLLLVSKFNLNDSLFLECGRLFFSGVLIYQISVRINNKSLLFLLSSMFIFFSFVGNFKIYLFCPSVLLLVVSLEKVITNNAIKIFFKESGNLTYALYLLHIPCQLVILTFIKKLEISNSIFFNPYFFCCFYLAMFFLAYSCYRFYENPLNKKIRSFFL